MLRVEYAQLAGRNGSVTQQNRGSLAQRNKKRDAAAEAAIEPESGERLPGDCRDKH
jgi:hypothetical protein